jgi:hypothetical protein
MISPKMLTAGPHYLPVNRHRMRKLATSFRGSAAKVAADRMTAKVPSDIARTAGSFILQQAPTG